MSGIRQPWNPWLADHVIFFCYRWLSWGAAVVLLLWQGLLLAHGWALLVMGLLQVPMMLFAQPYVRLARRNPAILILDLLYAMLVLHGGGWGWPFAFATYASFAAHAYGSMVLPGLLFGWRGGMMAGLTFVTLDQAALWVTGQPASDLVLGGRWEWAGLAAMMVVPPAFGSALPGCVEALRRISARRRQERLRRYALLAGERAAHDLRSDSPRFHALSRADERGSEHGPGQAPLAIQATKIRTSIQAIEDLRRVLFAPFPAPDIELAEAVDMLAMRFRQHTGTAARVTVLGRARRLHPASRSVLIRLVQESLLNIQQHAQATTTVLTLRYDTTSVVLLIQDDGVGLLDGTYERPGLHALRAMHYRLAELGGRLDVFETEGGGVTVRATMPLG